MSLSEGGLGLEVPLRIEQGESIRLRIMPHAGKRAVDVEGIVWNDRPARRARAEAGLRLLGCVVSDPSPAFLELFAELERRNAPPRPRTAARSRRPAAAPSPPVPESDLPRSRSPLPPAKPEPQEALPTFRVRMKQSGGPRTRIVTVHAGSLVEARELARAVDSGSAEGWEVMEVAGEAS